MKLIILGVVILALVFSLLTYAESGPVKERRDDSELALLMIRANIPGNTINKYLDLPRGTEFNAGDSVLVVERGEYGQALKAYIQVLDTSCVIKTAVLFDLNSKGK